MSVIRSMYGIATTKVRLNGRDSRLSMLRWGYKSVLSPLLFIIVLEALPREFKEGLPLELLYGDDLILMAETKKLFLENLRQ